MMTELKFQVSSFRKLFEKPRRGDNLTAWSNAPGHESSSRQALKGRNIYVALSGLNE
jgi:hypothetical protein